MEVDRPSSKRWTFCSAISPSGEISPKARTPAAALTATARGRNRAPKTPAARIRISTTPSQSSIAATDIRSLVRPYSSTYRSMRRSAEATTTRVRTQRGPRTDRTRVRSPVPPRGAQRRARAITRRVSSVAHSSCQKPWRAYSAWLSPVTSRTLS